MTTPYACMLHLDDLPVVVCGAGAIATRRLPALLRAGARVDVIAPEASHEIRAWHQQGQLRWHANAVELDALAPARMLFALTDDPALNARLCAWAHARGVWANNASDQQDSTLWVPARIQRGPLSIFISSAGTSPGLTRVFRRWLDARVNPEWTRVAGLFAALRPIQLAHKTTLPGWRMLGQTLPSALTWSPQEWENTLARLIDSGDLPAFDPRPILADTFPPDSE